jgi:membrane-associated phospholipid phosphatase
MQNNKQTVSNYQLYQLTKMLGLLTVILAFWAFPASHKVCSFLDYEAFAILNQGLLSDRIWQILWGYLNHPNETWMNIIAMLAINLIGICTVPKTERRRAILLFIYCWISFQLILFITHKVFCDWLEIQRHSPSIVIKPWVVLSEALNIPNIKVYSNSSFPAGHVLVLIYWWQFLRSYAKPWVRYLGLFTVILLTLPRMISGAHWLSDIIFTIVYANVWFYIANYAASLSHLYWGKPYIFSNSQIQREFR